jgi:hypothetical protein
MEVSHSKLSIFDYFHRGLYTSKHILELLSHNFRVVIYLPYLLHHFMEAIPFLHGSMERINTYFKQNTSELKASIYNWQSHKYL